MIKLFNIPQYQIDTSKFNNWLSGDVVTEFEESFAKYVGAKYAVSFNSATSAIFLYFKYSRIIINVPCVIPPVVPMALINGGNKVAYNDNIDWVGNDYKLMEYNAPFVENHIVVDSAQRCEKNIFKNSKATSMIFSFYPTKPIGSCDGGMIVSDNKDLIDRLRIDSNNGMTGNGANWEKKIIRTGHKMYMNSIQSYIANENLKKLDVKNYRLKVIRDKYNDAFELNNMSLHLYVVNLKYRDKAMNETAKEIQTGIHYNPMKKGLPLSDWWGKTCLSIPFHENLTEKETDKVIKLINGYKKSQRPKG